MKDRAKAQRERKKKRKVEPPTATFVCEGAALRGADDAWLAIYSSSHRILLVGEGDLSFAAALSALGGGANITASTLDTADELGGKYPAVQQRLAALRAAGATIAPGVDVTSMASHAATDPPYDRVVYNFPYAHVTKFAKDHLEQNRRLLRLFFAEAAKLLKPGGEVHVRNKLTEPYRSWDLHSLLPESLRFVGAAPFDPGRFPGYECRSNWGTNAQGYSVSESCTYVFARRGEDGGGPSAAAPAAMATSALLDAASRWRSSRDVTILVDGAVDVEIAPDHEPLLRELRALGLRTVRCAWTDPVDWASVRVALPLGTWSYADSHAQHEQLCAFLQKLDAGPDLAAARW